MYSNSNACFVCIAYQIGTSMDVRRKIAKEPEKTRRRGSREHMGADGRYLRGRSAACSREAETGVRSASAVRQSADSSAVISLTADLASPKSIEVFGSKYSSFSIPAKPGFIERLITITERESDTSRIGIP
jgi:hypothetical protein